ncbi:MAG: cellulase family glycosylhydrolase [Limisphaerales bacterium]
MNLRQSVPCKIVPGLFCGVALVAAMVCAAAPPPLMRDFIGINGHTVQFKPELYRPICGLARDYHPVEWDLGSNSAQLPPFPFAKNGVDWSKVYGSWRASGWNIDVSLMFESVPQTNWKSLEADARAYGQAFASEFGPSGKRPLADSVEIGNEPGKWNDTNYTRLFKAMAQGLRAGDPKLKIATCNVTAGKSGDYEKSVACVQESPELFDVLNVHSYAQLEGWPTWQRSFPEDPRLPHYLQDVEALCQWRDAHAPGKPVWVTEFGYDSSTQPAEQSGDFAKWVGVTDTQQAQWLVRSLLVFSAMPVERAYIYFFDDNDQPRVHASAGITRHFRPKPSYYALAQLQRLLGACRFAKIIVNEPGNLRVQEYRGDSGRVVWAAWSPSGNGRDVAATLDHVPGKLVGVQGMCLAPVSSLPPDVSQVSPSQIRLTVDESPLYLIFERP